MTTTNDSESTLRCELPEDFPWDALLSEETLPPTTCQFLQASEDTSWQALRAYLPPDLETSARRYGALRRKRQISFADLLLRLLLAYASGPSLDTIAARAVELDLVEHLTDNALHERFERTVPWLSYLIGQQLAGNQAVFPWGIPLRIRLLDASVLCRPGATGTDWRLHLGLNLQTGLIDHLSVTGDNIGERLADFPLTPGDLVLGDRIYGTRQGIVSVEARGAYSLVRLNWQNLPLQFPAGIPVDLHALLRTVVVGEPQAWAVETVPTSDLPAVPGRLLVCALTEEAANTARRKVRKAAQKEGKTPSALTLEASGYLILFTTVPALLLTTVQVVALYRMRWQIEIAFKRDKSALRLAEIRAKTDAVCYAVILAKCLLLLLVEQVAWATGIFSPSGDAAAPHESLSLVQRPLGDDHRHLAAAPEPDGLVDVATGNAAALFYRPPASQTRRAA